MAAVKIGRLIWDAWNKRHIASHSVTIKEVEEVCHGNYQAITSYRKRIQITGKTRKGKTLIIILSPENRDLKIYGNGIFYPVTAFEEVR